MLLKTKSCIKKAKIKKAIKEERSKYPDKVYKYNFLCAECLLSDPPILKLGTGSCRMNLRYTERHLIAFTTHKSGVLMDATSGLQTLYKMIDEDETKTGIAMDVSTDRRLIVTGAGNKVHMWNDKG